MSIPKVAGIETEYGIMIVGAKQSDPFFASRILLRAYPQFGNPAVSCASSWTHLQSDGKLPAGRQLGRPPLTHADTDLMLSNGARFYIDHGHPEYSTPECLSPRLLVAADKAGEQILAACQYAVNSTAILPRDQCMLIYKNNSDYKSNSYGCHENYLVSAELFTDLVYQRVQRLFRYLLPFFITRIIFCGAGKVGAENGTTSAGFQLSQRADFFETLIGLQTTQRRPLFNTRDEPHADEQRFRRLHVILGDANMAEYSTYLKVGVTQLVLQMLEDNFIQVDLTLSDPLSALQVVSRDLTFRQSLQLEGGHMMTALQIQSVYLDVARQYLEQKESSDEEWHIWYAWADALSMLPDQVEKLSIRLDWAIKYRILDHYLTSQGGTWDQVSAWQPIIERADQPARAREMAEAVGLSWLDYEKQRELYFGLRRLDLEYHDIRYDATQGEVGLFYRLQQQGAIERLVTDEEIKQLRTLPPPDTRAWLRGQCVSRFASSLIVADWSRLLFARPGSQGRQEEKLLLPDPLMGTEAELASTWFQLESPTSVIDHYMPSTKASRGEEIDEPPAKAKDTSRESAISPQE